MKIANRPQCYDTLHSARLAQHLHDSLLAKSHHSLLRPLYARDVGHNQRVLNHQAASTPHHITLCDQFVNNVIWHVTHVDGAHLYKLVPAAARQVGAHNRPDGLCWAAGVAMDEPVCGELCDGGYEHNKVNTAATWSARRTQSAQAVFCHVVYMVKVCALSALAIRKCFTMRTCVPPARPLASP